MATTTVKGLRETIRSLERFGVEVADLKTALRKVGQLVGVRADQLVRRDTGTLASTIRPGNAKSKAIIRAGSSSRPVGRFWWYPNDRFLHDAAEQTAPAAVALLDSELRTLIRRYDLN